MSIKDFTILTKLGQGAYSSVYKVERHADKTEYALKKVKLGGLSQKQLENAVNEVRILASIKCPNIISYKEAFLEGKSLCIIMEFADGGDLYQRIVQHKKKKKFFQEFQIWNLLVQVTRGLKVLHDLKIYHRDLKSANIFMSKQGQIKLGDMNVSKIAKNGLLYTQTGTPYYASPEVWKDQPYDFRSDIWSFGCIIYEMTTLEPPFKGEDMEGLFEAVTNGVYPPIPGFYSKQLASIIKLMLQQNPSNRPSTDKLLKSSLLLKKAAELNLEKIDEIDSKLLQTIRIPKKIHYLTDRLPKSNYDSIKSEGGILYHRLSTEKPEKQRKREGGTLPKLQNLIRYHEDLIKKKDPYAKARQRNQSLQIEGLSKNYSNEIKINRIHHKANNNLKYYQNRVLPPLKK